MSNKLLMGRYELIQKIGEGGMAVVYKSRDRLLNRYVAIKILRPEYTKDAQFVDSFRKESQAAAGLQHPNIVSVYDVGREGNIHFIVMELVDGKPLSTIIKERAPMDYKTCIDLTKQVASALSLAHRNNIIHRDIKPHNIMITSDGTAKLGDFGIAKAVSDSTLTETSKIIGSVHYFSPEQARGAYVDERSDIYSLGIVLYEMLTGEVPFDGDNPVQVALMHINEEITPPSMLVSGIPPALEKVVMKATDKFQSNRYKSADEMLEELKNVEFVTHMVGDSVFAGEDVEAFREENRRRAMQAKQRPKEPEEDENYYERPVRKPKKKSKKKRLLIILLVLLLLIGGTVGVLYAMGFLGNKVEVPDVTGKSYTEAQDLLEKAGLGIEKGESVNNEEIEKGLIAEQDPTGGTKVREGTKVVVNISKGQAQNPVPDLVGKTYDQDTIEAYLQSNGGFTLGVVEEEKNDHYDVGQIIRQDPGSGTDAEAGTRVNIWVCSGKKTDPEAQKVEVPSLIGLELSDAKARLAEAGLKAGDLEYEESKIYTEGLVMWQQYDAGTRLKKGTRVSMKISKGAPDTPEPEPDDGGSNVEVEPDTGNTDTGNPNTDEGGSTTDGM